MSKMESVKLNRFRSTESFFPYRRSNSPVTSGFFLRIRFWITSSTEEEERLKRVPNRAWIRENSSARTLMISSMASCPVHITHTLPPHSLPIFSIKDCRFRSMSVSVPTYCPTSSIMNSRRKSFGLVSR